VISGAGAMGLMQIMPVTGYFLSGAEGLFWTTPEEILFNPIFNIRLGSRFLSMLINQYGLDGGLAAYNGGEKQASIWLKNGKDNQYLFSETREYIPAVVKLYDAYQGAGL
jgi:soluble lytic murein transglycosylase